MKRVKKEKEKNKKEEQEKNGIKRSLRGERKNALKTLNFCNPNTNLNNFSIQKKFQIIKLCQNYDFYK